MTTPSTPTATADLPEIAGGAVRINAEAPAEQIRVIVAWIGDRPVTVPKELPGNLVLDMLRVYRRAGTRAATVWMFEEALGEEQIAALSGASGMTPTDLKALMEKVGALYEGQIDELLGN